MLHVIHRVSYDAAAAAAVAAVAEAAGYRRLPSGIPDYVHQVYTPGINSCIPRQNPIETLLFNTFGHNLETNKNTTTGSKPDQTVVLNTLVVGSRQSEEL